MKRATRLCTAAALCGGLGWGVGPMPAFAGPFVNGDFTVSPDFVGWQGLIRNSATDDLEPVDPPAAPWFGIVGGGLARLANDADYYEVSLSQVFDLPADARTLAFDYRWLLTSGDPAAPDFVQALLWLADLSDFIDLFSSSLDTSAATGSGTATTDISRFAGGAVLLEFLLQDGDIDEQDWFEIGRVALITAPVPVSPTWLLLLPGLGLWLTGGARRRSARLPATL
jgi:hypothetical protein